MINGLAKLAAWMAGVEDEHLEFKEAKSHFDFEKLVKYCAALANEGGGRIILGVTDIVTDMAGASANRRQFLKSAVATGAAAAFLAPLLSQGASPRALVRQRHRCRAHCRSSATALRERQNAGQARV